MDKFKGLFAALVTPYTIDQEVNYKEIKKLVRHLLNQGIEGFYVCGSTAEAFMLSVEERMKILEAVTAENNGQGVVIAHVGSIGTKLSIQLAKHAESTGADAISSVSPFYYKFSADEVSNYYFDLAGSTKLPMFVYNFPANSGFQLTYEILKKLIINEKIIGVKHTCSDFYQLERMKNIKPDLIVLNGFDEMLLSGLAAGADGGVGSTYSCMSGIYKNIRDAYLQNDMERAASFQRRANNVIEYIVKFGVFQSVKKILETEGIIFNGCRSPFHDISQEQTDVLLKVYKQNVL